MEKKVHHLVRGHKLYLYVLCTESLHLIITRSGVPYPVVRHHPVVVLVAVVFGILDDKIFEQQ